jgi:hypothetical protein
MWDEMVTTIIIKKANKMEIIFKTTQADVEGSSMIRTPRKQKRRQLWRRKGRR